MKTKKLLSIITSGLVITSMLAGCASSTSSSSSSAASSTPKEVHLKLFLGQSQARFKEQYTKFIDQWTVKYLKDKKSEN